MNDSNEGKALRKSTLSDKNCLITGATGGLGKEMAKLLVEKNCNLFLSTHLSEDLLNQQPFCTKR